MLVRTCLCQTTKAWRCDGRLGILTVTLWFHGYLPVYFALNLIKWIEVEKFSFYAIMHYVFLLMSFPSSPRMEYGDGEGKGLGNDRGLTEYSFCPCITVSKHEGRRWETPPNYWLCKLQAPKMKAWFIFDSDIFQFSWALQHIYGVLNSLVRGSKIKKNSLVLLFLSSLCSLWSTCNDLMCAFSRSFCLSICHHFLKEFLPFVNHSQNHIPRQP